LIRGAEGVREVFERNLRGARILDEATMNAVLACFDASVKEMGTKLYLLQIQKRLRRPY